MFFRAEKRIRRTVFHRTDVRKATAVTSSKATSGSGSAAIPKVGEKVGDGAEELSQSKTSAKARAMMEKMGWKSGEGLGISTNKGITEPIQQIVWYSRAGLG